MLFNAYGFYLIFITLSQQANSRLEAQLDQGKYPRVQTLVIKVPLYLPYQSDQKTYHRVDGELFIRGQYYNAVEHRIFRDTMYTVYVLNAVKTHLYQKVDGLFSSITQQPVSCNPSLSFWSSLVKDYLPFPFTRPSAIATLTLPGIFFFDSGRLPQPFLSILTPPPQNLV
ncbi:MAG: hypothetical protein ACYCOO_06465 [Chitinophagaceae bacterium]